MKSFFLFAILLPVVLAAQSAPVSLRQSKRGDRIVFTKSLQKALHDFDSSFVPLTASDYVKALRDNPRGPGGGYLSFCTGDFDRNGTIDAVILGRSGGGMRLLIGFQEKKSRKFRIVKVRDFPFFEPGEEDAYLTKVPAYTVNISEHRTISFNLDTFLLTYHRRGRIIYRWTGKQFEQHQLDN